MARPKAITKLSEAPSKGNMNWLVYADSGVGKTVLAGTLPGLLFLAVEPGGTESAKRMGSSADVLPTNTWDRLLSAVDWLEEEGQDEYEWVCLDSISEAEELCWRSHLREAADGNKKRIYQPAIQDYQIVGNKMKELIDRLLRLRCNIMLTAQAMRIDVENEEGDDTVTRMVPLIGSQKNGNLSQKLCGAVTMVGRLTVATRTNPETNELEEARVLHLSGSERFVAKDRHGLSKKGILRNPDFAKVLARLGSAPDPVRAAEEPEGEETPEPDDPDSPPIEHDERPVRRRKTATAATTEESN